MTKSNLPRRAFLRLAAGAAILPAFTRASAALDYPTRTVRIVCGFPAGLISDIAARIIAEALSSRLGQQFIVDNRPGAATNIATEIVARAAPDAHTLLVLTSTNATNTTLYNNLKFDLIRDFAPIATTFRSALVLEVNPTVPVKSVAEFISYAKANAGKVNYSSPGVGTMPHMAGELFKAMTGIDIVHVPYRNAYLPDLLGGQVQAAFNSISTAVSTQGKLRQLGVTGEGRAELLRNVPAIAEVVPGYAAYLWNAIAAPKDTPVEIVETLNRAINAVLSEPIMKARLVALGAEPLLMSAARSSAFVTEEVEKWRKVIRKAGIKAE